MESLEGHYNSWLFNNIMMQGKVSLVPILPTPLSYFPYSSVRLYQDEFINMVHEAVKLGQHVAVAAASGLGKTIGVLSATLPFVSENGFRILYVARTHKECDRAIEELKVVSKKCSGGVSGISIRGDPRHASTNSYWIILWMLRLQWKSAES